MYDDGAFAIVAPPLACRSRSYQWLLPPTNITARRHTKRRRTDIGQSVRGKNILIPLGQKLDLWVPKIEFFCTGHKLRQNMGPSHLAHLARLSALPRCSRAARARISGSCHCPTSPSGDLGTKSRVACILRSTWSFKLHIVPHSAPRRSASRVMHTRLSRLLVLLIVALATVLCTSHRVSTLRATLRLQVRASLLALLHTVPVALVAASASTRLRDHNVRCLA